MTRSKDYTRRTRYSQKAHDIFVGSVASHVIANITQYLEKHGQPKRLSPYWLSKASGIAFSSVYDAINEQKKGGGQK